MHSYTRLPHTYTYARSTYVHICTHAQLRHTYVHVCTYAHMHDCNIRTHTYAHMHICNTATYIRTRSTYDARTRMRTYAIMHNSHIWSHITRTASSLCCSLAITCPIPSSFNPSSSLHIPSISFGDVLESRCSSVDQHFYNGRGVDTFKCIGARGRGTLQKQQSNCSGG